MFNFHYKSICWALARSHAARACKYSFSFEYSVLSGAEPAAREFCSDSSSAIGVGTHGHIFGQQPGQHPAAWRIPPKHNVIRAHLDNCARACMIVDQQIQVNPVLATSVT